MRNEQDNLFEISKRLISFLDEVLKIADGKTRSIWQEVINDLNDILNHYVKTQDTTGFAEVQVSLSKYLDFYSTRWIPHDQRQMLNQFVSKIVFLSLQMISVPKVGVYSPCKLPHEDRACVFGPLGNRFIPSGDLIVKNWPTMPAKDAVNFEFSPDIKTLGKGEHLYRVVGPNNSHDGPWWILGALPDNKTKWRANLAVPTLYNSNDLDRYSSKYSSPNA